MKNLTKKQRILAGKILRAIFNTIGFIGMILLVFGIPIFCGETDMSIPTQAGIIGITMVVSFIFIGIYKYFMD